MDEGPGDALIFRPVLSLDFTFEATRQFCFKAHVLGH